jgi:hypothetical protein
MDGMSEHHLQGGSSAAKLLSEQGDSLKAGRRKTRS